MPQLIEYIDAIARSKMRDVLYLEFHPQPASAWRDYQFERDPVRMAVLAWLEQRGLDWAACGPMADPATMARYLGQVYVDVPYDESLPAYRMLRDYLEFPDGSMRQAGARFYLLTLAFANTNAQHDDPGFWEEQAAYF